MRQWVVKNGAGSSGKWLDVSADRFPGWIASFAARHAPDTPAAPFAAPSPAPSAAGPGGLLTVTLAAGHATFTAPDGSAAQCHPPFPPQAGLAALPALAAAAAAVIPVGQRDEAAREETDGALGVAVALAAHARRPRAVGVLLVRLGGYAAGVFTGYPPELADAKTGTRLVHGRSAAGGWSQQRFARRREKQAGEALAAAADAAVTVFGRWQSSQITARSAALPVHPALPALPARSRGAALDAVVLGGDRRAVAGLRDDPRLAPYLALATDRFLTVPDPKRAVLEATPGQFLAVRIWLTETDR